MPGLDRSGPMGKGKQTGRGMGKCLEKDIPDRETGVGKRAGNFKGFKFRMRNRK